jgi:1-aminocyclopropane-1-carboxylate deaminase/D-cysteine desulfhydrase-like pyridoxal-dependent ACC family enzyme
VAVTPAPRLAEALGIGSLLVKRDDLTGFAFGGNKARLRTEGLMLDPVYTAKALALAPRGRDVVFWHAGGVLGAVAAAADRS